jgi:uncharacterized protein YciI
MRLLPGLAFAVCCLAQTSQPYIFGFLRAHPERKEIPQEQAVEIQKGHLAHLGKMANDGVLVAAGPLGGPDLRGVVIFRGITLAEARRIASEDPAVVNKRLYVDAAPWPGPAGIGEVVGAKLKENPEAKIEMTKRALVVYWKTGAWPASLADPAHKETLDAHRAWIGKLQSGGNVLTVAPLAGSKDFVGVAVYKMENPEEALKICAEDPFVKAGWVRPQGYTLTSG